jgi:soluble cytochrome b562
MSTRTIVLPGALIVSGLFIIVDGSEPTRPVAVDATAQLPTPATEPVRDERMMAKLAAVQAVLAGLVTSDFDAVRTAAETLASLADEVPVDGVKDPSDELALVHFRREFQRLASRLGEVTGEGNLDAAAHVYGQLTATCIDCHQRLRDMPREIELLGRKRPATDALRR